MAVCDEDRKILTDFAKTHVSDEGFMVYNHHCTQVFVGKSALPKDYEVVKPGQKVIAQIDALVVRNSDHAAAFRIKSLVSNGDFIKIQNSCPHITSIIPLHEKPMISNSFIGLSSPSVNIIPFKYQLELTGFWA